MKINWKRFKKNILLYIIIIGILGSVLYYALNYFSRAYVKGKEKELQYAVERCEENFKQAWNDAYDMGTIIKDSNINFENSYNTMNTYNTINTKLSQILSTEYWADDVALYLRGENTILQIKGNTSLSTFYHDIMRYENWELADFRRAINEIDDVTIRSAEKVYIYNDASATNIITMMFPLPMFESRTKATLLIFSREYNYTSYFRNAFDGGAGNVCILDSDFNKIIDDANTENIETEEIKQFIKKNSAGRVAGWKSGKKEYVSYWQKSAYNNMTYFITLSDPSVYTKVSQTKFRFWIYMGAILLFLVLSVIFFHTDKKRRIQKYIDAIKANKAMDIVADDNELLYGIVKYMLGNADPQENFWHINQDGHEEQMLLKAILGNTGNEYSEQLQEVLDTKKMHHIRIFIIEFSAEYDSQDYYTEFVSEVTKACEEPLFVRCVNYMIEEKMILLVYSETESFDFTISAAKEVCNKVNQILQNLALEDFVIAVGSCKDDFSKVNLSYIDALSALERTHNERERKMIVFDDEVIPRDTEDAVTLSKLVESLTIAITQGSQNSIEPIVENIVEYIKKQYQSFLICKMHCFQLVSHIVKCAEKYGDKLEKNDVEKVLMYRNLSDFGEKTKELCHSVCENIMYQKDQRQEKLKKQLEAFVNENFCSNTFSLSDIADEFGLSPAYASSFFKSLMGDTFLNYVTKLRIERIKYLLRTTDMKIKDIVESCGYIDVSNFSRKFKATENMLLSEYRKEYKDHEKHTENFGDDAGEHD